MKYYQDTVSGQHLFPIYLSRAVLSLIPTRDCFGRAKLRMLPLLESIIKKTESAKQSLIVRVDTWKIGLQP